MSDCASGAAPAADRRAWLRDLRRVHEQQEDALAGDYDAQWGEIAPTHHGFVERFLSRLPPGGRVLDAACGTGKYFPMVLAGKADPVPHGEAMLTAVETAASRLQQRHPQVQLARLPCGHNIPLERPRELADLIIRIAESSAVQL